MRYHSEADAKDLRKAFEGRVLRWTEVSTKEMFGWADKPSSLSRSIIMACCSTTARFSSLPVLAAPTAM